MLVEKYMDNKATAEAAAEAVVSKIEEKFPDVDVELQFGGQPVYYYIVSVE
jgi:hypothetical protein